MMIIKKNQLSLFLNEWILFYICRPDICSRIFGISFEGYVILSLNIFKEELFQMQRSIWETI